MLERPFYQTTIAFLTVLALVGGVVMLARGQGPGVEIVPPPAQTPTILPQVASPPLGLVNIDTASAGEIADALPGIGPVLSERIVAYREANGPFERTDQLMLVDGIGQTTFDRLRDLVTVGE